MYSNQVNDFEDLMSCITSTVSDIFLITYVNAYNKS